MKSSLAPQVVLTSSEERMRDGLSRSRRHCPTSWPKDGEPTSQRVQVGTTTWLAHTGVDRGNEGKRTAQAYAVHSVVSRR